MKKKSSRSKKKSIAHYEKGEKIISQKVEKLGKGIYKHTEIVKYPKSKRR